MTCIYLNQAATSYPKPKCVLDAHAAALMSPPSAQFRSAGSLHAMDIFNECRVELGRLFQLQETERIFFSSGATDSLNRVLGGLLSERNQKKNVLITATEHNSVIRPLYNQTHWHKTVDVIECDQQGKVLPEAIGEKLTDDTAAVIINHCSNVTGMVQDIAAISHIIKSYREDILLILDVSQSAGCIPVYADDWKVDALIFTGHKSLFGVQGTGGYYVRKGIPFYPTIFGGTGRNSSQLTYEMEDYEYEVGTQNGPGVAALHTGVQYILDITVDTIWKQERELMKELYDGLNALRSIRLYGSYDKNYGPVLSFNVDGLKASDIGYILQSGYEITVRTGLHCAPLIHRYLETNLYGTVRVSISEMTTRKDVHFFLKAMQDIVTGMS